jgi:hypothetical protein
MSIVIPSPSQLQGADLANGWVPGVGPLLHPEAWQNCVGAWSPLGHRMGRAVDYSKHGNHGTLTNGVGYSGGAWEFSGSAYVDAGNSTILAPASRMVIAMWLKADAAPDNSATREYPLTRTDTSGTAAVTSYFIGWDHPTLNGPFIYFSDGSSVYSSGATQPYSVSGGEWHHIVGFYDGAAVGLYVDGSIYEQATRGSFGINSAGYTYIGASKYAGDASNFPGLITDVRIYSDVSAELCALLAQDRGISYQVRKKPTFIVQSATAKAWLFFNPTRVLGGGVA